MIRATRMWLRALLLRGRVESEMEKEMRLHLELETEANVRAGMSRAEARRAALIAFGGVDRAKEDVRDARLTRWLEQLIADLRYGIRGLLRTPGFTVVAVVTLALGIGATTAIFSVMDAVLIRPLPVEKPAELVQVLLERPGEPPRSSFTNPLWETVRDHAHVFAGAFAWSSPLSIDMSQHGSPSSVGVSMVSGGYFSTLGLGPAAGRLISMQDDQRSCAPVAVLSEALWRTRFGGTDGIVGRTVTLDARAFEIVGVAPPGFHGLEVGRKFDVAIPLCAAALFDPGYISSPGRWWLKIMARLTPDIGIPETQSRLNALAPELRTSVPPGTAGNQRRPADRRLVLKSAPEGVSAFRDRFTAPLKMLMAGVAIVLLIGCANLASLMLARASTRSRDFATRIALGAPRTVLARQLFTESVFLSIVGGTFGVLLAAWGTKLLVRALPAAGPVFLDASVNTRVLAFTAAVVVVTGLLIGVLPVLLATSASVVTAMRNRQMAAGQVQARFRFGKWLVGAQVALTLVLLIGGGLLMRTFVKLATLDPGFDRRNVVLMDGRKVSPAADTVTPELVNLTLDLMGRRIAAVPGVDSVARAYVSPMADMNWTMPVAADAPDAPTGERAIAYFNFVSPGYFATLRIPHLAGRDFTAGDTKTSMLVAIVNESAARRFFPGLNVIDRSFRLALPKPALIRRFGTPEERLVQVVGLVKDSKYESIRDPAPPTMFLPATQAPRGGEAREFLIRTAVAPSSVIPAIQRSVVDEKPNVSPALHTLADQMNGQFVQERWLATLAGTFGGFALLLAMLGLYGVLSYLVTHRQSEFGIRMALGANSASIVGVVMRDVVVVLASGIAAGLVLAVLGVSLLRKMLFDLEPRDPITIIMAASVLSIAALMAGYIPARRATRVDPMTALRAE